MSGREQNGSGTPASQRLDHWLWCARFLKTRAAAARFAAEGRVRINRHPTVKPHARVRPGDVLTFVAAGQVRVVKVLALGERRGPAREASALYRELGEDGTAGVSST
ncbi:MAG: S4 domain-containing protein [Elioraea sp.]|nr:S4 domain-containing protein [Elioraea sp.]